VIGDRQVQAEQLDDGAQHLLGLIGNVRVDQRSTTVAVFAGAQASGVTKTVGLPRRCRAQSYSCQFETLYLAFGIL
jgi:hypothetical protein